jgi:hypothetical protein
LSSFAAAVKAMGRYLAVFPTVSNRRGDQLMDKQMDHI